MARLDRNAPFDVIGGLPGAAYSQNGHLFNPAGFEVETYEAGEGEDRRTLARPKINSNPNLTVADEEEFAAAGDDNVAPSSLHWRHLKAMVEGFGHTWTGRQDALKFLEGRDMEGAVAALEDNE